MSGGPVTCRPRPSPFSHPLPGPPSNHKTPAPLAPPSAVSLNPRTVSPPLAPPTTTTATQRQQDSIDTRTVRSMERVRGGCWGRQAGAASGQLTAMVGGPAAVADRAVVLIGMFAKKNIVRCGGPRTNTSRAPATPNPPRVARFFFPVQKTISLPLCLPTVTQLHAGVAQCVKLRRFPSPRADAVG